VVFRGPDLIEESIIPEAIALKLPRMSENFEDKRSGAGQDVMIISLKRPLKYIPTKPPFKREAVFRLAVEIPKTLYLGAKLF
jgi:hypothetical protein